MLRADPRFGRSTLLARVDEHMWQQQQRERQEQQQQGGDGSVGGDGGGGGGGGVGVDIAHAAKRKQQLRAQEEYVQRWQTELAPQFQKQQEEQQKQLVQASIVDYSLHQAVSVGSAGAKGGGSGRGGRGSSSSSGGGVGDTAAMSAADTVHMADGVEAAKSAGGSLAEANRKVLKRIKLPALKNLLRAANVPGVSGITRKNRKELVDLLIATGQTFKG